jgi:hypothetical protein
MSHVITQQDDVHGHTEKLKFTDELIHQTANEDSSHIQELYHDTCIML